MDSHPGLRAPVVLLESYCRERDPRSFRFADLQDEVVAHTPDDVGRALLRIEEAVGTGLHAAGFVSYEAAQGLDPVIRTQAGSAVPLIWFGLFRDRIDVTPGSLDPDGSYSLSEWRPSIPRARYDTAIRRTRAYISAGDTYQVNNTFRMRADFRGDERAFYRDLCRSQRASYCAYLDIGRFWILSTSPELFFALRDGELTVRPMKGTRPRGRWPDEDDALALARSEKDRAENLMIVDLVRSDLGRVSRLGSVHVDSLWDVERYETVLQMTSSMRSQIRTDVGLSELFASLFPSGSVTGAPKVRTMQIIAEQEDSPRGVYTGSIGFVSPGPEACFNVAIRTVCIDRETGVAEYGVGGGVTYDSSADGEYEECAVKASVLTTRRPDFSLVENLLLEPGSGYFLRQRHLDRLASSASYFGFAHDAARVVDALLHAATDAKQSACVVQLILHRDGTVRTERRSSSEAPAEPLCMRLAQRPVDSRDPLLFHNTTLRQTTEPGLDAHGDAAIVVLCNELRELTECVDGNLIVVLGGVNWTPSIQCGLLPGTFRAELLESGRIRERVLRRDDLDRAEALYRIDSIRRWTPLRLADAHAAMPIGPTSAAEMGVAESLLNPG